MIIPAQTLRLIRPVEPFHERTVENGMTFGLSPAGYDVRVREMCVLRSGDFMLASTIEQFEIPNDVMAFVHDKSSWARKGLAVQNTCLEPGWRGFLTLELTNHGWNLLQIPEGAPIAQIVFHRLEAPTEQPYPEAGKYMDQPARPVPAKEERA